jgi:D-sedoheptulose 7-phosphate isomerase
MKFPLEKHSSAEGFASAYFETLSAAAKGIDMAPLTRAADLLAELFARSGTLYVCGNGGSAAISNHLLCDFAKGIRTDTSLRPRVVSLSAHVEIITAIGNDIDFAEIFSYQLRTAARPGDALMTLSASGNSENIVRAAQWAKANGIPVLALTGFAGGRSAQVADINIHVPAENYGVVEDLHQSVMHILAQFIRMRLMTPELVAARNF